MAQASLGTPTPLQTNKASELSAAIIRRALVKPHVHTQAGLSTASTARYGMVHNSEHVDMENEGKEHEYIIKIINGT